jgi:xanthine/CO dehydrogenase XdhC/CoxF family maturation factor
MPSDVDELFPHIERWRSQGRGVAVATVLQSWGSSPRAEGSHLSVNDQGEF